MMRLFPLLVLTLTTTLLTRAQIGYNAKTNKFGCPIPGKQYCAAGSLLGSSVISCTAQGNAQIKSCFVELSSILPAGYERAAICYEPSPQSGDAVCAFNGTGYTLMGLEIDVPETILCHDATPDFGLNSKTEKGILLEPDYLQQKSELGLPVRDEVRDGWSGASSQVSVVQPTPLPEFAPLPTARRTNNGAFGDGASGKPGCSNPWAIGHEPGRGVFTVNLVLVVPTPTQGVSTSDSTSFSSSRIQTSFLPSSAVLTTKTECASSVAVGSITSDFAATAGAVSPAASLRASTTTSSDPISSLKGSVVPASKTSNGSRASISIRWPMECIWVLIVSICVVFYCI